MSPATGQCMKCGWSMRPEHSTVTEYPATRKRRREGCCVPCDNYRKREAEDPPLAFDIDAAARSLGYWLTNRRRRGVPEDGYPVGDAA